MKKGNCDAYALFDAMGLPMAFYVPKEHADLELSVLFTENMDGDTVDEFRKIMRERVDSGSYAVKNFDWQHDEEFIDGLREKEADNGRI